MTDTLAGWHPFIVHFAVAFAIGSAAFDVLDFFFQRKRFEETGFNLLLVALPFLLLAVLSLLLPPTPAREHFKKEVCKNSAFFSKSFKHYLRFKYTSNRYLFLFYPGRGWGGKCRGWVF